MIKKTFRQSLTVLNMVHGDATGGRWQAMLNMTRALQAQGHEVHMLTGTENSHLLRGQPVGLLPNRGFYDPLAAWRLRRLLVEMKPDLILAHSGRSVYLARNAVGKKPVPVVAINHSHNIKRSLRADAFIHITPHVAALVQDGLAQRQISGRPNAVIPNLVEVPESVTPVEALRMPLRVGMMTRLVESKGVQILLEAAALLRDREESIEIFIAGDGEYRIVLEQQVRRLGLDASVHFLGWISGADKADFYQQVDVIVVPSLHDTQPLSSLDALAWGRVLVSSDAIGPRQVAEDGVNALVFETNNASALADQLHRLVSEPSLGPRLAVTGRQEAERRYAFAEVSAQLSKFLCELASRG